MLNDGKYSSLVGGDAGVRTERVATAQLPQHFADRFGWESMVSTVAEVYDRLPPEEQSKSCILAQSYGEAGAIGFFGKAYGLSKVISGHQNCYLWGPGDCTGEVVIAVGYSSAELRRVFGAVQPAAITQCEYCIPHQNGRLVYVCRGPRVELEDARPQFKQYF